MIWPADGLDIPAPPPPPDGRPAPVDPYDQRTGGLRPEAPAAPFP